MHPYVVCTYDQRLKNYQAGMTGLFGYKNKVLRMIVIGSPRHDNSESVVDIYWHLASGGTIRNDK